MIRNLSFDRRDAFGAKPGGEVTDAIAKASLKTLAGEANARRKTRFGRRSKQCQFPSPDVSIKDAAERLLHQAILTKVDLFSRSRKK